MNPDKGIVELLSRHSVTETVDRLQSLLEAKGIKLFALVDHSGEAANAGMVMPPTKLLVFGNPKAGTPVMLASASSALDLPLKILVREAANGTVISYNSAAYLAERHGLSEALMPTLAAVATLAEKAAE